MKIIDLKADMRNVDIRFRLIEKGEIKEDVGEVQNGFIKVIRGELRLNIGKYGKLAKIEDKDFPALAKIPEEFTKPPEDYRPPSRHRSRR
ncbi:MAG: hypothetical protein ACTSR1_09140 [Candidatus Heimdallarchaeota archaeon]